VDDRPGVHCDQYQWETTAFVLGELSGQSRAAMIDHLAHCDRCQAEVTALTDILDDLTGLVPPVALSPGLVDRIVDSLSLDTRPGPATGRRSIAPAAPTKPARRTRRHRAFALVAAAAVVAAVAGAGVDVLRHHPSGTAAASSAVPAVIAEMRTKAGDSVGQAVIFDQRPALVDVALEVPAGTTWGSSGPYKVLAIRRDGQRVTLGTVHVTRGQGGLQTRTQVPAADIATLSVEAPDGQDLCAGLLPPLAGPASTPAGGSA
jgi:hypothetical protein